MSQIKSTGKDAVLVVIFLRGGLVTIMIVGMGVRVIMSRVLLFGCGHLVVLMFLLMSMTMMMIMTGMAVSRSISIFSSPKFHDDQLAFRVVRQKLGK
jgi:hypothetical protein